MNSPIPDGALTRGKRVEELFLAAADLAPAAQEEFLERQCGPDAPLRELVRALLLGDRAAVGRQDWNGPAWNLAPPRFGPYRATGRIGAGGMGVVYSAVRDDAEFRMNVAIKAIPPGLVTEEAFRGFRQERQILARLEHPNIARLLDGGTTEAGVPYLVMEYVEGRPILQYAGELQLNREQRLRLFLPLCDAVAYAHRNLIVHRDIKPGNVLVTADGSPKLLDFGVAKLLDASAEAFTVPAMTPEYASPEQLLGQPISTASDIYSLGLLLCVLLTGAHPFPRPAPPPEEPAQVGGIAGDLNNIVCRALQQDPRRRYQSVEQFAEDLRRYLRGMPVLARPDTLAYRARKFVVRNRVVLLLCGVVFAAIALGAGAKIAESRRTARRFNEVRSLAHSFLFEIYDGISALPGSTSLRRLVVTRARQYLDSLARDAGSDASLAGELAQSYMRLGAVQSTPYEANLGDTGGALASDRKALAILLKVVQRNPARSDLRKLLCEARMQIGRLLIRENRPEEAERELRPALETARAIRKAEPNNPESLLLVSQAAVFLGQAMYQRAGRRPSVQNLQQALDWYRQGLAELEAAAPLPNDALRYRLATQYFNTSYPLWGLGQLTGGRAYYGSALAYQEKGAAIVRRLAAAHPKEYSQQVADNLRQLGWTRWKSGDLEGAMANYREALQAFESLAAADPSNLEARMDLGGIYHVLATTCEEAGQPAAAARWIHTAIDVFEPVSRQDPLNDEVKAYLAEARAALARLDKAR